MARNRIKDNSGFSITLRFKGNWKGPANRAFNMIQKIYPGSAYKVYPAEGSQEYTHIVITVAP